MQKERAIILEIIKKKLTDLRPYENNPRKNDQAVEAVAESIRQCGYCAPIVVDENMEILAGHTRLKALQYLGWTECEVCVKEGLTEEQKRKYRILDNKTNELAGWDFGLLEAELVDLDFDNFDFGFNLADVDALDDLFAPAPEKEEKDKRIQCPHCGEWFEP